MGGEIQDERLSSGIEKLSEEDLKLLTLYFVEGYTLAEISKVYGIARWNVHKEICKITKFLKKVLILGVPFSMARKCKELFSKGEKFQDLEN